MLYYFSGPGRTPKCFKMGESGNLIQQNIFTFYLTMAGLLNKNMQVTFQVFQCQYYRSWTSAVKCAQTMTHESYIQEIEQHAQMFKKNQAAVGTTNVHRSDKVPRKLSYCVNSLYILALLLCFQYICNTRYQLLVLHTLG